jgi:hypothetical protein
MEFIDYKKASYSEKRRNLENFGKNKNFSRPFGKSKKFT